MIGSIVPGVGTAFGAGVGAAIGFGKGLYDNYGTLTSGGGTDGSGLDASSKATGTSTADLKVMPPPKVKVSSQGMSEEEIKQMIIAHEGKRYRPYQDTLGLWTVGVGHLIGDGKSLPPAMNREFSEEEIMAMFEKDYAHHRSAAMNIPGFDKLDGRGQGALTDLTFNMGPSWISKWPKLKKQLGEGDTQSAAKNLEQSKWYGQVGNRAPTIVSLLRDSSTVSANLEGIAQGPESGYNATLHGNELIKRLTKDSILDKLANTPAGDMFSSNATPVDNSEMIDLMKEFVAKMDNLIDAQSDSNSIQTELLQYSKA
jgi:lysozyme